MPEQLINPSSQIVHFSLASAYKCLITGSGAGMISGDKQAARDVLDHLKASGAAFKELRHTLSPADLFIAKYNIQVHGPHEVSFALNKGVSRYDMLCDSRCWRRAHLL